MDARDVFHTFYSVGKRIVEKLIRTVLFFVDLMTTRYVGTSGWAYEWNLRNTLEWYLQESGLNAIELNMSFYRFPYPNMVKSWSVKGKKLAWVVKVHRSITHYKQLSPLSYAVFERFKTLFSPLEESIHYYLLQLPPKFTNLDAVERFVKHCGSEKIAVEFRHPSLFSSDVKNWGKQLGILLVSIDGPQMPTSLMSTGTIYERIHGRTGWYSHDYSDAELQEIQQRILQTKPETIYVFFNNNHAMLENAQRMYAQL